MNEYNDNHITNPSQPNSSLYEICERRFSRRVFLKTGVALGVGSALGACDANQVITETAWRDDNSYRSNFDFIEIEHGIDEYHHVAPNHTADILLRWGDPIFEGAPEFDVNKQTAESQLKQFGYNNDFIGFVSLPSQEPLKQSALLCVNHEYPLAGLMFPNIGRDIEGAITAQQVDVTKAAVGVSIVKVDLVDDNWSVDLTSKYNRRISALGTEIELSGPAAGHARLQTTADPEGRNVIGTFNNCAGGITPWGTYLSCEENFNFHFSGDCLLYTSPSPRDS